MIHIALQSEFSFKRSFLHMRDIHKHVVDGCVGIADLNNTFGHIRLSKEAKEHGFKPIYGVRLHVVKDDSKQRVCNTSWVFIAKNNDGLKEMYGLVAKAFDQFYYIPKLYESDMNEISENVYVIATHMPETPCFDYLAKGQGYDCPVPKSMEGHVKRIAIDNNNFPLVADREVYELLAGARKNGDGYSYNFLDQTYPQHIMNKDEWFAEYKDSKAMTATYSIAKRCKAEIPKADMVKWKGSHDMIAAMNMDKVKNWTPEYDKRLMYEIDLIKSKGYVDYFMIVSDLIRHCKKTMLVGPARGSSGGSLVCYLLDITEIDPIVHNLIFERFIDINRFDLPDIDIDFPDVKRDGAIKYLKKKYGKDHVMCLANVNRLKPKSAIGEFAKGLGIPPYETDAVKGAIIERSGGDARAAMCIEDTFDGTEPGKEFIEKYPKMRMVSKIEGHASHAGKHAAGILVSTLPLANYGSLNVRDEIVQMDKKDAEHIGLLKIDCLGLRTLSILEDVAVQLGKPLDFYYDLPLDDEATFKVFNDSRLSGVFQFEGQALKMIVSRMGCHSFKDITAITALARPGALNSGGAARYIDYSNGDDKAKFYSDVHKEITGDTYGIVVYQEQMMEIANKVGCLSWKDTQTLRHAASKSMGDEFFGKFKDKFVKGAMENGYSEEVSEILWNDISASGSWSFNKSHAAAYGLVSYFTAWAKANHPLEFAVASLNNASSVENAVKILRDVVVNEGMEYEPVDPDVSDINWTVHNGKLIGGLTNIKGIGVTKARSIIKARDGKGKPLTPSMYNALSNPETDFDILFPAAHYWGFLYSDPISHGLDTKPMVIDDIREIGEYVFIAKLVDRNLRDLNEQVYLTARDGERVTEHTKYLNFRLEDDTDQISCKIDRYKYEALGKDIAENGRIGLDWYLVRGKITSDWRRIGVTEIVNLNKYYGVTTR